MKTATIRYEKITFRNLLELLFRRITNRNGYHLDTIVFHGYQRVHKYNNHDITLRIIVMSDEKLELCRTELIETKNIEHKL